MSKKTQESGGQSAEVEISEEARSAAEEAQRQDAPAIEAVAEAEQELAAAREEAARNRDQYVRAVAELDNFRKRAARERQDLLKFGNENLLRDILPVIDNLERALEHAAGQEGDAAGLVEGVEMTLTQFRQVLNRFGVERIEALHQPFDPASHEAMGHLPSEQPPGTVVQVLQPGYVLNERLLRPAMVMIARAPEADADTTNNTTTDDNGNE